MTMLSSVKVLTRSRKFITIHYVPVALITTRTLDIIKLEMKLFGIDISLVLEISLVFSSAASPSGRVYIYRRRYDPRMNGKKGQTYRNSVSVIRCCWMKWSGCYNNIKNVSGLLCIYRHCIHYCVNAIRIHVWTQRGSTTGKSIDSTMQVSQLT